MIFELDASGRYVGDLPDGAGDAENWTQERPPQPCWRPRFTGSKLSTGEWIGEWVDDGPAKLTGEALKLSERFWRDGELRFVDYKINALEDNGMDSMDWRAYRQALRDYPESAGFAQGTRPRSPLIP